jgi:hypothetical protein
MIHIGTPHFYEKIRKNIKRAKTEGYVLFFE